MFRRNDVAKRVGHLSVGPWDNTNPLLDSPAGVDLQGWDQGGTFRNLVPTAILREAALSTQGATYYINIVLACGLAASNSNALSKPWALQN